MPDKEKTGKRITVPFSFIESSIKILIFIALITGTALALRPLQLTLQNRMEETRDNLIGRAEEFLGRKIQYGSMGPSIFGVLDIRNVRVVREDDSVLLTVSRLRLSYSLIELFRGNILDAFHTLRIDRPVLSLEFEKDADLAELFSSPGGRAPGGPPSGGRGTSMLREKTADPREILPENFSFRIRNGDWGISGSSGMIKLRGLALDAAIHQNRINFQGRWGAEGFLTGSPGSFFAGRQDEPSLFEAAMTGKVSGEYFIDTGEGGATAAIPSFSGNLFRLKPLTVSFFLSERRLEVRKTHDRSPAAVSLVYDLDSQRLQGRFEGENFSPQDLVVFTGSWKDYNSWLAFRLSGNAGFEKDESGALNYTVNISGAMPENSFTGPASLLVKAGGNGDRVTVDTLTLDSRYGDLNFRGGVGFVPLAPYGTLSLSNVYLQKSLASQNTGSPEAAGSSGNRGISGEFSLSTRGREINLFGENLTAGEVTLSALDASLYREEQGLTFAFSALSFRNLESYENVRMGTLSLEGSIDYQSERNAQAQPDSQEDSRRVQASLRLDSFSVGDILGLIEPLAPIPAVAFPVRTAAEDLSVTTEVFFTTDYEHILYNAPRVVAAYEGVRDVLVAASLSGTDMRFELNEGLVSWEKGNATISCSVDFSDLDDISFSLGTSHRDLAYFFEGMIIDKRDITVRGSYGFQAYLSAGETGIYSGYAQGDNIPIPSGDKLASLSFLFSLYYDSPSSWQAAVEKFEVTGITTPASPYAQLSFSGAASERGMNIPNLFFDDGQGPLEGRITLDWDSSYSYYQFNADIAGTTRNEFYGIDGTYGETGLELYISGQGMQFSRVSAQNAVADCSLRFFWESPASFEMETVLSSLVLYRRDKVIRASAEASMNSENLIVRQLKMNYSGLEASVPYIRASRTASRAETEARIGGNISGSPVDISLRGEVRFDLAETWFDLIRDFVSLDGSLTVDAARFDTVEADEPFVFAFSCRREGRGLALDLNGGPRNMLRLKYSSEDSGGNFYAALSAPSPVRGSIAGSINSQTIDAQGTDIYADMGSLWRFLPSDLTVAVPGGIATGSIRVAGPLEDPEFFGTVRGTSIQLLVPEYLPEPIRPVPVTISLNGSEMTFGPVDAAVGRGAGRASGWFRFDQWIPNIFNIDIEVPQDSPIPYDFDISGVLAHGLVSGNMVMTMENLVLSMSGDMAVHSPEISLDSSEIAALESDDEDHTVTVVTDINVRTGRRVEFFWPSADLPIVQANTDMGTGIHITSDEASGRFTLAGDVKLRSGEIFYLERNFYIREGTLFFRENEIQFDPRISARAEIRDQTGEGPVIISLIIDNAPLMSFTPRFESNPPLSQLEIYALLGQNPQGEMDPGVQRNLGASVAIDTLTQFTVTRRLQQKVRDFLGLDMLSMRTQFLQNVVLRAAGAGARDDGSETDPDPTDVNTVDIPNDTIDKPYRVGNYFDNSTVYIGKYFGADMFGQALLSVRYDENKQTYGGMVLEPEIGLEMRNPLFDIRFNIVPLHPENWFIDDTSISLIWRRTF